MAEKLRCPNCGTPMNRHAEKALNDSDGGGAIASVHYCPGCGKVEIVDERKRRRGGVVQVQSEIR